MKVFGDDGCMTTFSLLNWFLGAHPIADVGSDVNAVGVLLAQGFVFLGEEGLTFQVRGADLTKTNTQSVVERSHVSWQHPGARSRLSAPPTAHTKQVSCQVKPRASRNLSPASMGKSQPWQLVPNRL